MGQVHAAGGERLWADVSDHDADGGSGVREEGNVARTVPLAVLSAALPAVFPPGDPTEEDTPSAALRPLAVELALAVSAHERNSRHLPRPLRPLAGMREQTLQTPGSLARMESALWRHRSHPFIRDLCSGWLARLNADLEHCLPDMDGGVTFPAILAAVRSDRERLSKLAAALWALNIDRDPQNSWAFKIVCALLRDAEGEVEPEQEEARPLAVVPDPRLKGVEGRIRELAEKLRRIRDEARELRKHRRELEERVRVLEGEKLALSDDLARSGAEIGRLQEEVLALRAARDQERLLREATSRQLATERRQRRNLDERLEEVTRELSVADEQRVTASSALNAARLELQELQARMKTAIPSDDQVMAYLTDQDQRLEEDLLRLQGGDAEKARRSKSLLKKVRDAFLEYRPEFRQPRPPAPRSAGPLRYYALGGAEEIGASAYVLELAGHRILIDAGIRVGRPIGELGPDLSRLGEIDAMILTHAHTDHVGWAAAVIRHMAKRSDFEVFATLETAELLPVMMKDSRRQYERMAARERVMQKHIVGRAPLADPYERADIEEVLRRLRPVRLDEPVPLGADLRFSLHRAGHILGAASVLIEGDGRRVFVSGDFADFWQVSVRESRWPEDAAPVDLLLLESTYGSRPHPDRALERERFTKDVLEVVERGGVALVACFALGRAQEVLRLLAGAMRSGRLCPVWIDGMIQDINEVYRKFDALDLPDNFREVRAGGWNREEVIAQVRREPGVIVSTSGMLSGGPMVEYAAALLPDGRNRIFFCGYLDEESPGAALRRLSDRVGFRRVVPVDREDGSSLVIRASAPAGTFNLSAHADRQGLIKAAEFLRPLTTVLVHGDSEARACLADDLRRRGHRVHDSSLEFAVDDE